MRPVKYLIILSCLAMVPCAGSADREIVQLKSQLEALQDQTTRMQLAFDKTVGSMHSLNEKNADALNKLSTTLTEFHAALNREQVDSSNRMDRISGQIQRLNDSLDELRPA